MKILKGFTASGGIVKGKVCIYAEKSDEKVPHYGIAESDITDEVQRLKKAYEDAIDKIDEYIKISKHSFGEKGAKEIIRSHKVILEDEDILKNITSMITDRLINAEHAVKDIFDNYIKSFEGKSQHFQELENDIKDVKQRLLSSFTGEKGHFECPAGEREAVIVVSKRLTPSMVMNIPKAYVLAFVTSEGGFTTHATILARSYGVPIVFGIDVERHFQCGDEVVVDGSSGRVILSPDAKMSRYYIEKIKKISERRSVCELKKGEPSKTRTGRRVLLKTNITTPGEFNLIKDLNHDGIGLLRTEFLFSEKKDPPDEEHQFRVYSDAVEEAGGRPVTVRLLDISADKSPAYLDIPVQVNPDLGIRGARALDMFRDIYLTQLKALLRCSARGRIKILYPMVSDINDIMSFKDALREAKKELKASKKAFDKKIEEGVMFETPSSALMASSILNAVDFANIGSNDLLQYTLAAERGNMFVEQRYHLVHPALIKLIEMIVKAGKKHGKEICLCGEISGFEEYYPLFLGIGLKSFSVAPSKFDDIKCHLLHENPLPRKHLDLFYKNTTKNSLDKFFYGSGR